MKFSVALAAALFLPVLVNAQYNYPPDTTTSETDTYPESSTGTTPTPSGSTTTPASSPTSTTPAVPASNSTNVNVSWLHFCSSRLNGLLTLPHRSKLPPVAISCIALPTLPQLMAPP